MFNSIKKLYSSKNIHGSAIDNYLSKEDNPILSKDYKDILEKCPTIKKKCTDSVNNMKAEKSLSLDRLPSELYKYFWKQ